MIDRIVTYIVLAACTGFIALTGYNYYQAAKNSTPAPETAQLQLHVQTMRTAADREKGLQDHAPLANDEGMVFVFDSPAIQCMYNKNVAFAVDVGFFDAQWHLMNGYTMKPGSDQKVCSKYPAAYALETKAGWFKEHALRGNS